MRRPETAPGGPETTDHRPRDKHRGLALVVLLVFVALYLTLAISSARQKSATWDEPLHLSAGLRALAGDFRVDPEHPPLLRAWAALPLAFDRSVQIDQAAIGLPSPAQWLGEPQFQFGHAFLYRDHDATPILSRSRTMVTLLGVALGALIFLWSRALYGLGIATATLALYTLEPNLMAHARLVTTDFGFALLSCATLYFLWRLGQRLSAGHLLGLVLCFALAFLAKFTAVSLVPITTALLLLRALRPAPWPVEGRLRLELTSRARRLAVAVAILMLLAVATWAAIWAGYGFRYLPSATSDFVLTVSDDPSSRLPTTKRLVGWVDEQRGLPNAYSVGFLLGQLSATRRAAYLLGETSHEGWWYYFPIALLVKTPVSLLLLLAAGIIATMVRRGRLLDDQIYLLLPICLFLAAAMSMHLNIGLRHILMVYPLAIVAAATPIQLLWTEGGRAGRGLLAALALLLLFEHAAVAPHYLAFFNRLAGGPANGHRILVDSNLDWGQDLPGLADWMEEEGVELINLSYFGMAEPAHYGIQARHLPGAPLFAYRQIEPPQLPGWIAISATNEAGPHLAADARAFLAPFREREPDHVIGYSLHLYWVEQPWW